MTEHRKEKQGPKANIEKEGPVRDHAVGPFAPPLPSEAEQTEGQPMAAARDETTDQQSFLPTTAPADQMDEKVARRFRDPNLQRPEDVGRETPTPHGKDVRAREDENREMESPPGYSETDERGFRHLKDEPLDEE